MRTRRSRSGHRRASARKRVPNTEQRWDRPPVRTTSATWCEGSLIHPTSTPPRDAVPAGPDGTATSRASRPHGEEAADMSMAVVMSEMPDVWRKVLAEHVPDGRQHCRACFHDGGRASWPCQTYRIAQEAKWVAEGGLPGTGPHGPGPSRTRLSPPD